MHPKHRVGLTIEKNALGDEGIIRFPGGQIIIDGQQLRNGRKYDAIVDAAGKTTFLHVRPSLEPGGIYVTTDPGFLWHDALVSLTTKRAKLGIVRWTKPDLETLAGLIAAGEYRAVIDRTYPLEDVVEAHRYVDTHQKVGNVVLTL